MVTRVTTAAFEGIAAVPVDVQVQISPGLPGFQLVGLADKAVSEARERVRAALHACGLALPAKRITVNLAPADLPKEGSHYDLPIALAVLGAAGAVPEDAIAECMALGELSLDGVLRAVNGVLPAALLAAGSGLTLLCPPDNAREGVWAGSLRVLAPADLPSLIRHFRGTQPLTPHRVPDTLASDDGLPAPDLRDVRGQESAKRALEIAAAGGHNLLMSGPPGAGKSMLAARLPGLLPPLSPAEMLEVSVIASLTGDNQRRNGLLTQRPYRAPHHSAGAAALTGGGRRALPGEITLAHRGVLFLDELPEFPRNALEALRQPLETGVVTIARAERHVTYPARFQLIAAMNPCKCGYLADAARACRKAPHCGRDYQDRISGPLLDRFDLRIDLCPVPATDLATPSTAESSHVVAARIARARTLQRERYAPLDARVLLNAEASGETFDAAVQADDAARDLLMQAAARCGLSARGYARVLRTARTIADLDLTSDPQAPIGRLHAAEALSLRMHG